MNVPNLRLFLVLSFLLVFSWDPALARSFAPRGRLARPHPPRILGYRRPQVHPLRKTMFPRRHRPAVPSFTAPVPAPLVPLPPDIQAVLEAPVDVLQDLLANEAVPLEHRQVAALVLGNHRQDSSLMALVGTLSVPFPALQQACIMALRRFPGVDVDDLLLEKLAEAQPDIARAAAITLAQRGVTDGILFLIGQAHRPEDILDQRRGLPVGPWRTIDDPRALAALREAWRTETEGERRQLLAQAMAAVTFNLRGGPGTRVEMPRRGGERFPPAAGGLAADPPKDVMAPVPDRTEKSLQWEAKGGPSTTPP